MSQQTVDDAIDAADAGDDASERVAAMIRALSAISAESLPIGRALIPLTVAAPDQGDETSRRRAYRRIAWIERALEPLRSELEGESFEPLVSALAMVIGWEALIVLHDLRGLGADEHLEVSVWAARALIRAALDDQAELQQTQVQR